MGFFSRTIASGFLDATKHFPALVLTGARQVGKSTLLKMLFPDVDMVTFDPHKDVESARSDPDLFLSNHGNPLILDEIQYAPEVASAVKRAIDRDKKPGAFFITGSQQWRIMKTLGDSLAGRAALFNLEALSWEELAGGKGWLRAWLESGGNPKTLEGLKAADSVSLFDRLWRGWMPGSLDLPNEYIPTFHESYFHTYIERDVRQLMEIREEGRFSRFAALQAALTAQEVNLSQWGRDVGVSPATARSWSELMESTFLIRSLAAYSGNGIKRVSQKAKTYFMETGLACNLLSLSSPRALGSYPNLGSLFESMVVGELRKQCAALALAPRFWHWRSNGGAEVDVVLEYDNCLYPIEIKLNSQPGKADASGLNALRLSYPQKKVAPGLIIAPCRSSYPVRDDAWVIPWDGLLPYSPIPASPGYPRSPRL
jgi:uncharacterized protein